MGHRRRSLTAALAVIVADPARRIVVATLAFASLTATSDPPEEKLKLPVVGGNEAMHSTSAVEGKGRSSIGVWVKALEKLTT